MHDDTREAEQTDPARSPAGDGSLWCRMSATVGLKAFRPPASPDGIGHSYAVDEGPFLIIARGSPHSSHDVPSRAVTGHPHGITTHCQRYRRACQQFMRLLVGPIGHHRLRSRGWGTLDLGMPISSGGGKKSDFDRVAGSCRAHHLPLLSGSRKIPRNYSGKIGCGVITTGNLLGTDLSRATRGVFAPENNLGNLEVQRMTER